MTNVQLDPTSFTTDPWASAQRTDKFIPMDYPSLGGMKVMLIVPDDHYRKKLMPLGPGYVATAMQRCDVDVVLKDFSVHMHDDIEIAKVIVGSGIKIFAMGALYPMIREVERICNIIRAVVPDATIILGGSLPSPIPEFVLRRTRADIATIGEAEITIVHLMDAIAGNRNMEDVQGIAYIADGEFIDNGIPLLPRQATRDEVGWPALDLYPIESYLHTGKFHPFRQDERIMPIVTGRGCPYACNFCYRASAYRIRPYEDIVDEMEYLVDKYRLDGFYMVDDLLMLSQEKITNFCQAVIERGLKIRYNCNGRVNTVTPGIIKLLKDSGRISVFYGLESGNNEILRTMSKKTTTDQIYSAIRLTREAGIFAEYAFMFGQPGENEETLKDTVQMLKKISYGEFRSNKIFGCVPFPGTGLFDWCKETGRIKDDQDFYDRYVSQDWSLDQIPINMTDLDDNTVRKIFSDANRELSDFFINEISDRWVEAFGGDVSQLRKNNGSKTLSHIRERVESSASTFDTSGRT